MFVQVIGLIWPKASLAVPLRVAQCVTLRGFVDACCLYCCTHRYLYQATNHVVASKRTFPNL